MDNEIQRMLDDVPINGIVKLPNGEFEGPFTVNKPCTIKGNSTTFWADKGPVMIIAQNAGNVYLKNLRIEITGATNDFRRVAIENNSRIIHIENIEVDGDVKGCEGESGWILPKSVNVGSFASQNINTFTLNIFNNSDAEIVSNINGISVSPSYLHRGLNTVILQTEGIKDRTCIYGELLIKSSFVRRVYVSGRSSRDAAISENKNIFNAEMSPLFLENYNSVKLLEPISTERVNNQGHVPDGNENMTRAGAVSPDSRQSSVDTVQNSQIEQVIELQRGQRISLPKDITNATISFTYQTRNVTVDTYAFQLTAIEKVVSDEGLIFFGNDTSTDESIRLLQTADGDRFEVDLNKNTSIIEKIRFVCSIYNDKNEHNSFASVARSDISIIAGSTEYRCSIDDVKNGESMISIELYMYKSEWKIRMIASEIHKSISNICADYGVTVD